MANEFRSKLQKTDFLSTDKAVIAGVFTKIGEYEVKAGEIIFPGFDELEGQQSARGRIYGKFQNATPAEIKGTLRLSIHSPQDQPLKVITELRTEDLNTSASDKTLQTPFPVDWLSGASEDKKIVLEFKSDTSDTIEFDNTSFIMDITRRLI